MSSRQITLNLTRMAETHRLLFELDPERMSENGILEKISQNRLYESETAAVLHSLLSPGDRFLDIGAHVGYFSMLVAAFVGPRGQVYAFEPEERNYQRLLSHMAMNQFRNVMPFRWAVGGESKVVDFYINQDNDGGHALWDPGKHELGERTREHPSKVPVYQIRLDDLYMHVQPGLIKLIKMDVEGNEVHALKGARELLRAGRVPAVIAEVNGFALEQLGSTEREMRELMAGLGYEVYLLLWDTPTKLAAEQYLKSRYVFNLLFVSAELQQMAASQWPQATSLEAALRARGE